MKDYKIRQILYNRLNPHDDLIGEKIIIKSNREDIIKLGALYFKQNLDQLYFPAKSYSVAIIYSFLLSNHFGEDFFSSLDDPDLLGGNDRYFVTYNQDKQTYDLILQEIGLFSPGFELDLSVDQVAKTVEYFSKEFLP